VFTKGIPSSHRSVNTIYIVLISILGTSVAFSLATWCRLLMGLMKSPKSRIIQFSDRSSRINESSLYRLRKEVSHLSYIIKTVEAFLSINTRLVVLIDGLDVCEQQRILQILDVCKLFIF
jgi:ankyrin repeat-rich membrane spanning protein